MSSVGLSARLKISERDAADMINKYFDKYRGVKNYLDGAAKDAVRNRCSTTISGRKRYYSIPPYDHPDRKKIQRGIERQGMNASIQGSNADGIKESMILLMDRIKDYDAKLLLTVHDELIVEVIDDQKYEIAEIISKSLVDGFGQYFSLIPMEAEALIGKSWLKSLCENKINGKKCGGNEMKFIDGGKYGTTLVCSRCGADQE
jgi:DNA polymerase-1